MVPAPTDLKQSSPTLRSMPMSFQDVHAAATRRPGAWSAQVLLGLAAGCCAVPVLADSISETLLYSFSETGAEGAMPESSLLLGKDGAFYGTTSQGGSNGQGAAFRITRDGSYTLLHSFNGTDGATPVSGLVAGNDGNYYGTTCYGGTAPYGGGTVYRLSPQGMLTTLYNFTNQSKAPTGTFPCGGLALGADGKLYGTTRSGGAYDQGTAYRIGLDGRLATLHAFRGGADGADPEAALVLGSDGNFYGTTSAWFVQGQCCGTVFRLQPGGALTTLYAFSTSDGQGFRPLGGLLQGKDGNYYGSASAGGSGVNGSLFRITPAGVLSKLYDFSTHGNADGTSPASGLILGPDGGYWGVTPAGGYVNGEGAPGTVYRLAPDGAYTTLYVFRGAPGDGGVALASPTLGADGALYGTSSAGGANHHGAIYRLADITPTVSFTQSAVRTDSNGAASVAISLSAVSVQDVTIPYSVGGTEPASRYSLTPAGSVTIPAGARSASISLAMSYSPSLQCDHTVVLNLGQPGYASLGAIKTSTITVHNYQVQFPQFLCGSL
jgi:uncharacterized repeat protein (TIGR03803 family)